MGIFSKNTLIKRAILLFCFSLILLIPLGFISSVVNERNDLYNATVTEIGSSWGGDFQTVAGPVIVVPYTVSKVSEETITDDNGKKKTVRQTRYENRKAVILPDVLKADVVLNDEVRNRGIYKATVYSAKLSMSGSFSLDISEYFNSTLAEPSYDGIYVAFGLTDTRALMDVSKFSFGGKEPELISGTMLTEIGQFKKGASGVIAGLIPIPKKGTVNIPFEIVADFRGSNSISVIPLGKRNDITISSSWPNPSFYGLLPAKREISENGFTAEWNVSHLVRNYGQVFSAEGDENLEEVVAGVSLYDGITHYRHVVRAVKYGYLFISLSILVLFIFEISSGRPAHFIQYGVVGASLVMFYLLILSLSEHIPFMAAYLISAAAIVIPVSAYIVAILKDKRYGAAMFVILTGLYMILLSILKMEDYALITGTVLIMCTLYALMYLTRQLKGETIEKENSSPYTEKRDSEREESGGGVMETTLEKGTVKKDGNVEPRK